MDAALRTTDDSATRRGWVLMVFGWWTLYALVYASQAYFGNQASNTPITWSRAFSGAFLGSYLRVGVSFLIFWLAWSFPLEGRRWKAHLALHAAACPAVAMLEVAAGWWFGQMGWYRPQTFSQRFYGTFHQNVLEYALLLCVAHGITFYRRARQRELAASRLEAGMVRAQLQALKMQLHPHFLFNALNAVSTLMHRDVEAADRVVARLSELLRATLESGDEQEVPLAAEVSFLRAYLEIEQVRFGERLRVEVRVDPEALQARVPHLVLQPLVENAIRHGIAPRVGPGSVQVRADRVGGRLVMRVADDGLGLDAGAGADSAGVGVGLANTRARLEHLYGRDFRLELADRAGGGTEVTVEIPFRPAGGGEAP
ncbi:MAG: histidine kinase internal region [Gemmatimonadetes bacterium]|nr:histidine kinase internal region [Gemmatimonadota bacterium]